jgi:DNA-binding beta-propeller fold protein YncE
MLNTTTLRKLSAAGVAAVCALIGAQSIAPTPASAMLSFPFDGQLAPASGSFGRTEPAGATLANLGPDGVAIDDFNSQTYVAESVSGVPNAASHDSVAVFSAAGSELSPLDGSVTPAGSFGSGLISVAANNGTGAVYVMDSADNAIDVFDSTGNYVCQITGTGNVSTSPSECDTSASAVENPPTPAGGFHQPRGVAVDQATGAIYVLDSLNGVVGIFNSAGAYQRQIQLSQAPGAEPQWMYDLAVSGFNEHVYVTQTSPVTEVQEFDATGTFVTAWTGENTPQGSFGFEGLSVAADDHSGNVYISGSGRGVTYGFSSTGAYLTQFTHNDHSPEDTQVDQATGKVYVAERSFEAAFPQVIKVFGPSIVVPDVLTEPATEVQAHSATLHGTVGPDETQLTDCRFEYGLEESYGHSAPCVPVASAIPADGNTHPVSAQIEGLKAGLNYRFRLQAANAAGQNTGSAEGFSTPPGPAITGDAARNLTGTSTELIAQINPQGAETTYHFEYDTRPYAQGEAAHGTVVPGSEGIPGVSEPRPVHAALTGLNATTTYYWRVVATNSRETTTGPAHSFRYSSDSSGLPDNRAYEIVTPPEKNGALLGGGLLIAPPDIAGDGNRVMAASIQCFAESQSCTATRELEGEPFSFTRTSAGWQTTALAPPPLQESANSLMAMNADAGTALFSMPTPPVGEDDFYARMADGALVHIGPATPRAEGALFLANAFAYTPDLSHVVYILELPNFWAFDGTISSPDVYELSGVDDPTPSLVGVSGGAGSTTLISDCATTPGGAGQALGVHAVSVSGSTVYFTARGHSAAARGEICPPGVSAPATNELYARIDNARTVAISRRSPVDCATEACRNSLPSDVAYEDASEDGKQVFFTDTQQLTDAASEDGSDSALPECGSVKFANGCNLYEYDFTRPAGQNLVAVSAGDVSGLGPEVQRVLAVSDDGSHVYFVARGVLDTQANDQGAQAIAGGENLYVYERDAAQPAGRVRFIATLSSLDQRESNHAILGSTRPSVTPDGRFLVFTSHADLTVDDSSMSGAAQVFRYDAQSGQLVRISIGENGFNDNGNTFEQLCHLETCAQDASIAPKTSEYRRDQTMSDDGSYVFFTSPVGLTAGALNDVQIATESESGLPVFAENVYEYHGGHVYLISDGKDTSRIEASSAVQLLGSDRTGANVFFSTADQLVPQDTDTQRDYYDARICTAASPCIPPTAPPLPPCLGEACHGTPAAAPARLAPASASFSGEGNLPAVAGPRVTTPRKAGRLAEALRTCRRGHNHRRRAACEAQARRRYSAASKRKQAGSKSRKGGK